MIRNPMQAGTVDQGGPRDVDTCGTCGARVHPHTGACPWQCNRDRAGAIGPDQGAQPDQDQGAQSWPAEIAPRPDVDHDPRDLAGLRLFTYVLAGHGTARLSDDDLALALHASVYGLSRELTGPAAERIADARRLIMGAQSSRAADAMQDRALAELTARGTAQPYQDGRPADPQGAPLLPAGPRPLPPALVDQDQDTDQGRPDLTRVRDRIAF